MAGDAGGRLAPPLLPCRCDEDRRGQLRPPHPRLLPAGARLGDGRVAAERGGGRRLTWGGGCKSCMGGASVAAAEQCMIMATSSMSTAPSYTVGEVDAMSFLLIWLNNFGQRSHGKCLKLSVLV